MLSVPREETITAAFSCVAQPLIALPAEPGGFDCQLSRVPAVSTATPLVLLWTSATLVNWDLGRKVA